MDNGVVYCTLGNRYVGEALVSAQSVRRTCGDLSISLYTDCLDAGDDWDALDARVTMIDPPRGKSSRLFDAKLATMAAMKVAVYDRVLFLDSDTYVCTDLRPVFAMLDRCHMALTFSARRVTNFNPGEVPEWFPEYSSGFVLYNNTLAVNMMLERWARAFREFGCTSDQVALRATLYEMPMLKVCALPSEYNCYVQHPVSVGGPVHVLHGRGVNLPSVHKQLAKRDGIRAYIPDRGVVWRDRRRTVSSTAP